MSADTQMLDCLFINPFSAPEVYGELGELVACEPPLWCRLLAGYIRDRDFSVQILDAEAERLTAHRAALQVNALSPKLIVLVVFGHQPSASSQMMAGAGELAQQIKRFNPAHKIIMVGGHVAALPERTLREEAIDYACNGEGPLTVLGLLRDSHPAEIPGLVWWDFQQQVQSNSAAPLIADMDKNFHGQAWDLLPMQKYRAHNWQCFGVLDTRHPYASIYTSLGCPYQCAFCCIQAPFSPEINGPRYRTRSAKTVVDEIVMLYERHGVKTFKFIDELFIVKKSHYIPILEGIISAGLGDKINIWCYSRVDTIHPEALGLLKRAGIKWLALGIESGSKFVRDGANKAMRNEDIVGVVRQIQKAGISVIGNFIFGLPDDTLETMQETLDLALECNCEFGNFYSAMAYPGSLLYETAVAAGSTLPDRWSGYSQHSYYTRPLDTDHIPAREVIAFRDEAFQTYFTHPKYLAMIREKFGADTVAHIKAMTQTKLRRKLLEDVS